jgi:DNA-binding NarL/FixJ family response regulator
MAAIKVIIADDHQLIRDGLQHMLQSELYIQITGSAVDGADLLSKVAADPPDVVILDIKMPVIDGIEAAGIIRQRYPETKLVLLSMHDDEPFLAALVDLGIEGFLVKNSSKEEIVTAIETVFEGNTYYSKELMRGINKARRHVGRKPLPHAGPAFTQRELEVLQFLCMGSMAKEIAGDLGLSPSTVHKHIENLLEKSGSRNGKELITFAITHGWYLPPRSRT